MPAAQPLGDAPGACVPDMDGTVIGVREPLAGEPGEGVAVMDGMPGVHMVAPAKDVVPAAQAKHAEAADAPVEGL